MNRLLSFLVLAVALICAPSILTGCKSAPEVTATKVVGAQILTVDSAMKAWADWVNQGRATQQQVDDVRNAYMTYFIAAKAEEKALTAYVEAKASNPDAPAVDWSAASKALQAAQTDLLNLILKLKGGL